jgi:ABC-2 type transport system ATP-binding protein
LSKLTKFKFQTYYILDMNAIEISNLTKTYKNGFRALKGISLTVKSGEFYALLGANGAGKTTTISILTSLVNKTEGEIKVFGFDLDRQSNDVKNCIGVVPQEFNLNIFEKVIDIVIQQAGYYGLDRVTARNRSENILKKLDLWEKRNEVSRNLSGGMKRRLMIARALIHEPKLLILDEPTAGVDVELRHGMWTYLQQLNKEGVTVLLTTHYLEEVEQLCNKAAIIKDGKIVKNDTVKNLTSTLDSETYSITFEPLKKPMSTLGNFEIMKSETDSLEIELKKNQKLSDLILELNKQRVSITNLQPKDNKLEKLFLSVLQSK